jgi:hypothetical protein
MTARQKSTHAYASTTGIVVIPTIYKLDRDTRVKSHRRNIDTIVDHNKPD